MRTGSLNRPRQTRAEDAGELVATVVVDVVLNGFRVEREVGRIVSVGNFRLVRLCDGGSTPETIMCNGHIRGVVRVVDVGDFIEGIRGVEGG